MRNFAISALLPLVFWGLGCKQSQIESLPPVTATLQVGQPIVGTTNGLNVVTATFSIKVKPLSSNNSNQEFVVTGCTSNPTVTTTNQTVSDHSVVVAVLNGGNCSHGTTVTVTLRLDRVHDTFGFLGADNLNPPANPVQTYDIDTTLPVATLDTAQYPGSQGAIKNGDTASIALSFANADTQSLTSATGSTNSPPAGLTIFKTGTAQCSTVEIDSPSISGATVSVSDCTGDGKIQINANAGIAAGSSGLTNVASNQEIILVQNTPPTVILSGANPMGGTDGSNTITATFSGLVTDLSLTNSNGEVVVSGCATSQPSVAISMSVDGSGHSVATLSLSGGICDPADTVTVELHLENITDLAGTPGQSSDNPTPITYTIP